MQSSYFFFFFDVSNTCISENGVFCTKQTWFPGGFNREQCVFFPFFVLLTLNITNVIKMNCEVKHLTVFLFQAWWTNGRLHYLAFVFSLGVISPNTRLEQHTSRLCVCVCVCSALPCSQSNESDEKTTHWKIKLQVASILLSFMWCHFNWGMHTPQIGSNYLDVALCVSVPSDSQSRQQYLCRKQIIVQKKEMWSFQQMKFKSSIQATKWAK